MKLNVFPIQLICAIGLICVSLSSCAPTKKESKDLSSLLNLLPTGTGTTSGNTNIFQLLSHLTNGTSISQVMAILSLLNDVHHLQGDITALPNDIINALNQLSNLVGVSVSNLTDILNPIGKRGKIIY